MTLSQLYIPQIETQSSKNVETWLKQSNLDQYSSPSLESVFLRDILARLKHIIGATAGRYYIHVASPILRERLLTCQRRAVHCFPRSRAASPGCSEMLRCALQT